MYLNELPVDNTFSQFKKKIEPGQYYAIEKNNSPALIFLCLVADPMVITPTEIDDCIHGQYQCFPILKEINKDTILALQQKCKEDYNSFVHRGRVTVSGYTDLTVLSTKFKTKK